MLAPLESGGPAPLYKRVKTRVIEMIASGHLSEGMKLPSEREFTEAFGVSRITVRQALTELVRAGHLRSHAGKGFFVAPRREPFPMDLLQSFTANAQARGLRAGSRLIEGRMFPAPAQIAGPLGISPGTLVLELRRLRLLDGQPVVMQSDWLDASLAPGLLSLDWTTENRSLYAELIERYGLRPSSGESKITARAASEAEAALLELAKGDAVLVLEQIAHDPDRRPVNLSLAIHHPGRYPLRVSHDAGAERARM